ncbi:MAG: response regulator [Candidatus Omnitrophica bacterium]|nr:response regulator [Candidatus Omnitrophota bacterium]
MGARWRILVIDDEKEFTHLLRMNLEATGDYEVREVNFAEEGFDEAKEFKPDLILLDLVMPALNGKDIAEDFKADDELRAVPIAFVTAMESQMDGQILRKNNRGYPVLYKPVSVQIIAECIGTILQGKQKPRRRID